MKAENSVPFAALLALTVAFACSVPSESDATGDGAGGSGGIPGSGGDGVGGVGFTGGAANQTGGAAGSGAATASGGSVASGGAGGSGGIGSGGDASGGAPSGGGGDGSGAAASGGAPAELPSKITVWIAGDSTVANTGGNPCPAGWGGKIGAIFDERVTVVNSAIGGRSVRTWLYDVKDQMDGTECALGLDSGGRPTLQARWQAMLDGMKPGDFLFIQFGINDGSPTCPRHVGIDAFKESYGVMAAAAKERGAQPIFVTPVSSIACNGSTPRGTRGGYVPATHEAGVAFDVPVIDLHELSVQLYASLNFCPVPGGGVSGNTTGPVGDFFCDDHTHFDHSGAVQIAQVVANALSNQNILLAEYLK